MKSLALLMVMVCITGCLCIPHPDMKSRPKRGIFDDIALGFTCGPAAISAANICKDQLDERTKDLKMDKDNEEIGKCCYYAGFKKCVEDAVYDKCGADSGDTVSKIFNSMRTSMFSTCDNYTFYTPQCLAFLYYPYIILGGIIFLILAVGCCIGACCCR